jgi:hypothetical protein
MVLSQEWRRVLLFVLYITCVNIGTTNSALIEREESTTEPQFKVCNYIQLLRRSFCYQILDVHS